MAKEKVTGAEQWEIERRRESWNEKYPEKDFDDHHCLAPIPCQPPEYSGPDRFCTLQRNLSQLGDLVRCNFHGGNGDTDNLSPTANMKHGMNATREHLVDDFSEKDQALYDWIMDEWPGAYDIDLEKDPQAKYDFHRLAAEIVRAERGRGYLIQEGEVNEEPVRNEEGRVVIDDSGDVVTEKSEHYLAQMLHRQDKKLSDIEKQLGITRKERLRQESTDSAVEAIKGFAELGSAFLDRDSNDYDPDDTPWESDNDGQDS